MNIDTRKMNGPVDVVQRLGRLATSHGDAPAVVSSQGHWTFAQLRKQAADLGAGWLALGVQPGDRVATLMPNSPELLIHYLACLSAGLVVTPLNYRFAPPEIDHALQVSGAAVLLCHGERQGDIRACKHAGALPHGIVWHEAAGAQRPTLGQLMSGANQAAGGAPPRAADPCAIFFTSGSTGLPKGVTHSYETLGWMLASLQLGFELKTDDVVFPGSSMSHIAAFALALGSLAFGCQLVVPRSLDAAELFPLMRKFRPTILVMLPAALLALERDHGATAEDFRSLRICMSGGDKVPLQLEHEFSALSGLVVDEGYGMTEFGYACMNPPSGVIKEGSIGRPLPGFEFQLRDKQGQPPRSGSQGQLWVRSRSNMLKYWNSPGATAQVLQDGWLDTGDVMRVDRDGYYWFFGRTKQLIIHDGSNIAPQEVEEALLKHPALQAAGVVGVRDPLHGETVRAYIELRRGAPRPTDQQLQQVVRSEIAAYKAPEEIIVVEEMPLNATGKVDRARLKRLANPQ